MDKVKYKIVLKLKRLFFYLGFAIERIPDADRFFDELDHVPEAVQKYRFQKIGEKIRLANNHQLYNSILRKYVPEWKNNFTRAEFVGTGTGEYSFNVYRKVCFDNQYYFEKVYFNDGYDLLRMEWFYRHTFPVLNDNFKTSKLVRIVKGQLISIVYFEFADLVPLSKNELHRVLFTISRKMFTLTNKNIELARNAPSFIKNYTLHYQYFRNISAVKELLKELSINGLTTLMIEQIINEKPLVLTHGDIYYTNIYANNYIVDWDSFGIFPHGFETAFILSTAEEELTLIKLKQILLEEYKDIVDQDQWGGFELSCLYFYLLFTASNETSIPHSILQQDIVHHLEKICYSRIGIH